MATTRETPPVIRSFEDLGFDYSPYKVVGVEVRGYCAFCGGDKLYINIETGQWSCKSGSCQLQGNKFTFIQKYYDMILKDQELVGSLKWGELAQDRQIAPEVLRGSGIVWDGDKWLIPIRNAQGALVNLKRYWYEQNTRGLTGFDAQPYGMEAFKEESKQPEKSIVYLCEGEWDAIALRDLLDRSGQSAVVIGLPGAGIFKDSWIEPMLEHDLVLCFDNDQAGLKGTKRAYQKLRGKVGTIQYINWPIQMPDGYDIRDFVTRDGTLEELQELTHLYVSDEEIDGEKLASDVGKNPSFAAKDRPTFEDVVKVFERHAHMTPEMILGLRLVYAVVLTTQIDGDPLWMHVVGPPGSGKTLIVMSLHQCPSCYAASTITPNALVSGFSGPGGSDPSLLPKLNKRTFALKDFTEVLKMPRTEKDEVYSILRGAYDGEVIKFYGNGLIRKYHTHFNMVSGVTHAVFAERTTSLGERFLLYHMVKGVDFKSEDSITRAIRNVGKEGVMTYELGEITKRFLEVTISPEDIPEVPEWFERRIVALAQIVALLRASVDRDSFYRDRVLVRPQPEMGTRLAKQFTKLAIGSALTRTPLRITDEVYGEVIRVAMDTCVGFNVEVLAHLARTPGMRTKDIAELCKLPLTTITDHVDDLELLGAIGKVKVPNQFGKGAATAIYYMSDNLMRLWTDAQINKFTLPKHVPLNRKRIKRRLAKADKD